MFASAAGSGAGPAGWVELSATGASSPFFSALPHTLFQKWGGSSGCATGTLPPSGKTAMPITPTSRASPMREAYELCTLLKRKAATAWWLRRKPSMTTSLWGFTRYPRLLHDEGCPSRTSRPSTAATNSTRLSEPLRTRSE